MKPLAAFVLAALPAAALAFGSAPPGKPAPAFGVTDLDGKPARLEDYKGRIVVLEWNNFGCPFGTAYGAKNYVVAALEEMKAGKPVSTPSTTPYGCSVKYR